MLCAHQVAALDANTGATETLCVWLIFEALYAETLVEGEVREAVGALLTADVQLTVAARRVGRKVDDFVIYKWARFCSMLAPDHPLLPVFWQGFFALFFQRKASASATGAAPVCFGHLFFVGPTQRTIL